MCLIGAVVCLLAAPRVQLFVGAGNGWPHNVPWQLNANQLPLPRL